MAFLGIAVILAVVFSLCGYLAPSRDTELKNNVYESGIKTTMRIGSALNNFSIKYYIIAILFVLFDIEILFMYGWALSLKELGFYGLVEMFIFMGILLIGLFYVYQEKVLKWK